MNNNDTKKKNNNIIKERDLLKKYEQPKVKKSFNNKKNMYLEQTDRNYKDGDKN